MISVKKDYNDIPAILESEEVESFREAWRVDAPFKPKIDKKIYTDKSVADALNEIYQDKCAMCERKYYGLMITHYRPTTLYPWLAYEWSNLFLLCPECNKAKRERFPLKNEKKRVTVPQISFYDWRANSISLLQEEPQLLNPEIHNVENLFELKFNGELINNTIILNPPANVEVTLEVYELNRIDLRHGREGVMTRYFSSFSFNMQEYLKNDFNAIDPNNLLTITDKYFNSFFSDLALSRSQSQEYSFVHKYFYENFHKLISKEIENKVYKKILDVLFKIYVIGNRDLFSILPLSKLLINFQKEISRELNKTISVEEELPSLNYISRTFINFLSVEHYYFLKNLNLKNLGDKREIYFVGENGDGKTLLLQSILFGLKHLFIEKAESEKIGRAQDTLANSHFDYQIRDSENNEYSLISLNCYNDIYAYGINRASNNNLPFVDEYGFMSLFGNNHSLRNPIKWLQYLYSKDLENAANELTFLDTITVSVAKELLINLLGEGKDLEIEVTVDKVTFKEKDTPIFFDQLSEGYRSVITWVCDLLSHLATNQSKIRPEKNSDGNTFFDYKAIVLVDEIDLHLHPKWAYSIVKKLRSWFPNIQFFFTTHSPIVILGASDDAVFYKVYKEEGVTKISEPYYSKDFSNAMANIIITSPLFDLETAAMKTNSNDVDTNDSSLHSKIYKKVSEYMEEKRKQGKKLFTESEIDQLIDEALLLSKGESA